MGNGDIVLVSKASSHNGMSNEKTYDPPEKGVVTRVLTDGERAWVLLDKGEKVCAYLDNLAREKA